MANENANDSAKTTEETPPKALSYACVAVGVLFGHSVLHWGPFLMGAYFSIVSVTVSVSNFDDAAEDSARAKSNLGQSVSAPARYVHVRMHTKEVVRVLWCGSFCFTVRDHSLQGMVTRM